MTNILEVRLRTVNEKVKFSASARKNDEIKIDRMPPVGDGSAHTPLELFMTSLASSIASTVLTLLREKMNRGVYSLKTVIKGILRGTHPESLSHLSLKLMIASPDVLAEDVDKALALAKSKMCPIWPMIKPDINIEVKYEIEKLQGSAVI